MRALLLVSAATVLAACDPDSIGALYRRLELGDGYRTECLETVTKEVETDECVLRDIRAKYYGCIYSERRKGTNTVCVREQCKEPYTYGSGVPRAFGPRGCLTKEEAERQGKA